MTKLDELAFVPLSLTPPVGDEAHYDRCDEDQESEHPQIGRYDRGCNLDDDSEREQATCQSEKR